MNINQEAQSRIDDIRETVCHLDNLDSNLIEKNVELFVKVLSGGNKIAFVGNGGSAAEAMHIAAEFVGKCVISHQPLNVICLNESQSALTAIANDFGVEAIFSRLVEAHLVAGDLLIALSTSGKSQNIINALHAATNKNVLTQIWMGDFPQPDVKAEFLKVKSKSTPRIQEIHLMWGHIIAELVEIALTVS